MHLTPREQEKLMVVVAADLARRRQARGVKLNHPETIALIPYEIFEGARDGRSVSALLNYGAPILKRDDMLESVPAMIHVLTDEATFHAATNLLTVHNCTRCSPANSALPTRARFRRA